jgi:hypothetical protein
MQLLGYVFEQDHTKSGHAGLVRLLHKLTDDSVLPQDDREQSSGRDTQFELFVAAICQSAGLTPVDYEEPDVTCTVDGNKFGIAAKRLKNVQNFDKRVKKAAQQIQNAQRPGIIALDTCVALNRDNDRIVTPIPDEQFGLVYQQALNQFISHYQRKIFDWVDGKGVRGVIFHDHQVRIEPNGEWGLSSMTVSLSTARDDERANHEFSSFWDSYKRGLRNVKHLT